MLTQFFEMLFLVSSLVPYQVLRYYPLTKFLRFGKGPTIAVNTAADLLVAGGIFLLPAHGYMAPLFQIYRGSCAVFLLLLGLFLIKGAYGKQMYVYVMLLSLSTMNISLANYADQNFFGAQSSASRYVYSIIIHAVMVGLTLPIAHHLFKNHLRPIMESDFSSVWRYIWLIPGAVFFSNIIFTADVETASRFTYVAGRVAIVGACVLVSFLLLRTIRQSEEVQQRKLALERAEDKEKLLSRENDMLTQLNQLKSDFYQAISHDLKNPLTVIGVNIERALDIPDEAESRRFLGTALKTVDDLYHQLQNLILIGRLDAGDSPFMLSRISSAVLMSMIQERYEDAAETKQILFEVRFTNDFEMLVDPVLMWHVLDNIIYNAMNHIGARGQVLVTTYTQNGRGFLSVKDNGPGIPPAHLPHLFERGYKVDAASKGSGLGLYIADTIAKGMGCRLSVQSTVGEGSTFILDFAVGEGTEKPLQIFG